MLCRWLVNERPKRSEVLLAELADASCAASADCLTRQTTRTIISIKSFSFLEACSTFSKNLRKKSISHIVIGPLHDFSAMSACRAVVAQFLDAAHDGHPRGASE